MDRLDYTEIERVISAKKLNWVATVVSIVVVIGAVALYARFPGRSGEGTFGASQFALFLLCYLLLIAVHELIHGLCFRFLGHSRFRIFVDKKNLIPMCAAQDAMPIRAYRWSAAMPTLVLGVPPTLIGLMAGYYTVYLMGWMLLLGGIGDAAILWMIRGYPQETLIKDHPSKPGCIVNIPVTETVTRK